MDQDISQSFLKGQVAIVTGSSKGIGLAIAKRLLREGVKVIICGTNQESLRKAENDLLSYKKKGQTEFFVVDISNQDSVSCLVESVFQKNGRIDILVNNAGVVRDQLLLRMSEEQWDTVLDINLKGVFLCTKAVLKHMIRKKYGRIINISSVAARGNAGQSNYSASKAGIIGFSRSIAKEVAKKNITVNVVCPGFIETQMTQNLSKKMLDHALSCIPVSRFGRPEEIAELVYFLTNSLASYITGEAIHIDGGILM